jgi:LmbE family N-acetylglucosaminyl deacetylase
VRRVALSLLAHPDDAEILCGGTLIRLRQAGYEVHIATMTAGDCGSAEHDAWAIAGIRVNEARLAAEQIGATYHCLDERDGYVLHDKPTLAKTYDLFRRICPTLVLTHPREDYMIDHEQTHLVGRAASFLFAAPNLSPIPIAVSGSAVPYLYCCDPIEGIDPRGKRVTPTTYVDVSAVHPAKLQMLACHASQRAWLRAHHGMDEYLDAVDRHDASRGVEVGVDRAEAFVQHRGHAYPADDMLAKLFPASRAP